MPAFRILLAFGSDVGGAWFSFAIKDFRNETRIKRIALAFRSAEVVNELSANVADIGPRPRFVERQVVNRPVRRELDGLCRRGKLSVRSSRRRQRGLCSQQELIMPPGAGNDASLKCPLFSKLIDKRFPGKKQTFRASLLLDYRLSSGKVTAMAQAKASAIAAPPTRGFPVRRFTQPLNKP